MPRSGATRVLEAAGLPVGVVQDASYDEHRVTMQVGDRLYLYSDGLPETANANGVPFGRSRLLEAAERGRSLPLEGSLETVQAALRDFRGSADAEDDVSMLALEVVTA
jgi:sigma-B regulation protein RsbU (phosphoserine phosphatase)